MYIMEASSWASAAKPTTVRRSRLGKRTGTASPEETRATFDSLYRAITNSKSEGAVPSPGGNTPIQQGTLWTTEFKGENGVYETAMLVIGYNAASGSAIAMGFSSRPHPRRIKTIDCQERRLQSAGAVDAETLRGAIGTFLTAVKPDEAA